MILNFKNLAENLIITIVVLIAGMYGGYLISISSAERMLENQKSLIETAIRKETTSITNEFKTEIKKFKVKKDGKVDLTVEPILDNDATTIKTLDSIMKPKKQGWYKRVFRNKNRIK